jgi:hypothetical protein
MPQFSEIFGDKLKRFSNKPPPEIIYHLLSFLSVPNVSVSSGEAGCGCLPARQVETSRSTVRKVVLWAAFLE